MDNTDVTKRNQADELMPTGWTDDCLAAPEARDWQQNYCSNIAAV